jgi:predicted dehydrogenase
MSEKLRWGILGTGNIARQFAAGVQASQRGRLTAVASRTAAAAQTFASDFGIAGALEGYQRLIDDPTVDAIYNSLPNTLHHQWTIAALKAGKHVLCEKPLGANAREAEEIFDVAAATRRVMVEAFMYRSHPLTLAVVEAVKRGDIGELRVIRSSFCFHTKNVENNIRFKPALAGGSLMDVGCYCINFSRLHAGCEPSHMVATGHLHSSGVDDYAAGALSFPNGMVASFCCGMIVHTDNTAMLCGSEGYIEIPIPWKPPAELATYIVSSSVPPRMDQAGAGKAAAPGGSPREVRHVPVSGTLYGIEADDFAATVMDGRPPRLSRADTLGNMRVLDELRRQVGVKG